MFLFVLFFLVRQEPFRFFSATFDAPYSSDEECAAGVVDQPGKLSSFHASLYSKIKSFVRPASPPYYPFQFVGEVETLPHVTWCNSGPVQRIFRTLRLPKALPTYEVFGTTDESRTWHGSTPRETPPQHYAEGL